MAGKVRRASKRAAPKKPTDEAAIEDVYKATFVSLLFHPSPEFEGGRVQVLLDVPEEAAAVLLGSSVVTDAVRAFQELAGVEVELGVESLSETPDEAWHRLRVALVTQAKQPELYAACERLRR